MSQGPDRDDHPTPATPPPAGMPSDPDRRLRDLERKRRELAALVVHDLRNPIAAILGHLELLRGELAEDGRAMPEAVAHLEALAHRALGLLAILLDVEELEEGLLIAEPQPVELAPFFDRLLGPYRAQAEARKVVVDVVVAAGAAATFDPNLMTRVLENLLDNAVRYANRRGRVELRADVGGGAVELRVGNDGPPVPDEDRPRLFERYYRIEARRAAARENRGLGLYFCKLAVAAHGGTITVESTPDLPTTFVVRLPRP